MTLYCLRMIVYKYFKECCDLILCLCNAFNYVIDKIIWVVCHRLPKYCCVCQMWFKLLLLCL